MGTWNFRTVKRGDYFAIYYGYYDDEGKLKGLSEDKVSPDCEDLEDLRETLRLMLEACEDSVIEYETLKPLPIESIMSSDS